MATNETVSAKINPFPVFIHSLFRTGSTYIYNVFRRSHVGYVVFQEALHEVSLFSKNKPDSLIFKNEIGLKKTLRHPKFPGVYFQGLADAWPSWQSKITEEAIYAAYFGAEEADIGISFWKSLIDFGNGRAVFQECRTAGRIKPIKDHLGGYHVYLWRNPWDQWWSYKVTDYFDVVNQLIVRANSAPAPIQIMRKSLGMNNHVPRSLSDALSFFDRRPMDSEKSYLVFYMLWCLGLQSGMRHAHLLLNIDQLSGSEKYRAETTHALESVGLARLDFSDCSMPRGRYGEADEEFFAPLEKKVYGWLQNGGWSEEAIRKLMECRREHAPWSQSLADADFAEAAIEQSMQIRSVAMRFQNQLAQAAAIRTQVETRAEQAVARAQQAEAVINQWASQLAAVYNSVSWRITAPLRWPLHGVRLVRQYGVKARTKAVLRKILLRATRFEQRRPRLKHFGIRIANKLGIAARVRWGSSDVGAPASRQTTAVPIELQPFSRHARQIYADLKRAINQHHEGED